MLRVETLSGFRAYGYSKVTPADYYKAEVLFIQS